MRLPGLPPQRACAVLSVIAVLCGWSPAAAAAGGSAAKAVPPGTPAGVCRRDAVTAPTLQRLRTALTTGRFVAYQPTSLRVVDGHVTAADPDSTRADLLVLRQRFDSLVTYDAIHGLQEVPRLAAQLKFNALVIGVWNPLEPAEVAAAVAAAQQFPHLVVGISLGNETLFFQRANAAQLQRVLADLHARLPGMPLSTTEPFHLFLRGAAGAPLLPSLDFLLANVHPLFQPWFRGADQQTAVQFVVKVTGQLAQNFCGPILVKETGEPAGPAASGFTPQRQASFYQLLRRDFRSGPNRGFAYFSAFDAPWRAAESSAAGHPEESFWGLYDAHRVPKQAALDLPALTSPPVRP